MSLDSPIFLPLLPRRQITLAFLNRRPIRKPESRDSPTALCCNVATRPRLSNVFFVASSRQPYAPYRKISIRFSGIPWATGARHGSECEIGWPDIGLLRPARRRYWCDSERTVNTSAVHSTSTRQAVQQRYPDKRTGGPEARPLSPFKNSALTSVCRSAPGRLGPAGSSSSSPVRGRWRRNSSNCRNRGHGHLLWHRFHRDSSHRNWRKS